MTGYLFQCVMNKAHAKGGPRIDLDGGGEESALSQEIKELKSWTPFNINHLPPKLKINQKS